MRVEERRKSERAKQDEKEFFIFDTIFKTDYYLYSIDLDSCYPSALVSLPQNVCFCSFLLIFHTIFAPAVESFQFSCWFQTLLFQLDCRLKFFCWTRAVSFRSTISYCHIQFTVATSSNLRRENLLFNHSSDFHNIISLKLCKLSLKFKRIHRLLAKVFHHISSG